MTFIFANIFEYLLVPSYIKFYVNFLNNYIKYVKCSRATFKRK